MDSGVQVISNEIVKPSSQTPPHPIKLKLSYVDKILKHVYVPFLFFYQADESKGLTTSNHLQISQKWKHSLLHILPSFYSLAGRLKHKRFVDCKDAGVEFFDARVRAHLKDVKCTNDQLKQYLPSTVEALSSLRVFHTQWLIWRLQWCSSMLGLPWGYIRVKFPGTASARPAITHPSASPH